MVVILGWWTDALLRLLGGASDSELVHFMDGPYAVEVSTPRRGVLRFRALEGSQRDDLEVAVGEQSADAFVTQLLWQARAVLESCQEQNWSSPDSEQLYRSISALAEMNRSLGPS